MYKPICMYCTLRASPSARIFRTEGVAGRDFTLSALATHASTRGHNGQDRRIQDERQEAKTIDMLICVKI